MEQTVNRAKPYRQRDTLRRTRSGVGSIVLLAALVGCAGASGENYSSVDCALDPNGEASLTIHPGDKTTQYLGDAYVDDAGELQWRDKITATEDGTGFSVTAEGFGPGQTWDGVPPNDTYEFFSNTETNSSVVGTTGELNVDNPLDPANMVTITFYCNKADAPPETPAPGGWNVVPG